MQRRVVTVKELVVKGSKIRFLSGHTVNLNDMDESKKMQYVTKYYYEIEKVYSKKGGLLAQRLNMYCDLLTPKPVDSLIKQERTGRRLPVQSEKLKRRYFEDEMKLARKYPTIGDKIQSAFVERLTNQERKELTIRLKRLGAKQVMIEDHTEGNRITTEPVHYVKYLFN